MKLHFRSLVINSEIFVKNLNWSPKLFGTNLLFLKALWVVASSTVNLPVSSFFDSKNLILLFLFFK